jgi:hypothetical protein
MFSTGVFLTIFENFGGTSFHFLNPLGFLTPPKFHSMKFSISKSCRVTPPRFFRSGWTSFLDFLFLLFGNQQLSCLNPVLNVYDVSFDRSATAAIQHSDFWRMISTGWSTTTRVPDLTFRNLTMALFFFYLTHIWIQLFWPSFCLMRFFSEALGRP